MAKDPGIEALERVRWLETRLGTLTPFDPTPLLVGFRQLTPIRFESSGSFVKAPYEALGCTYALIECQGASGASGGAASTGSGQHSFGGGSGAGAYARRLVALADLPSSLSITVGAGGSTVNGGGGNDGGDSSAGSYCIAAGGKGGPRRAATSNNQGIGGGLGGAADDCVGDLIIPGGDGTSGFPYYVGGRGQAGDGGSAYLGGGRRGVNQSSVSGSNPGNAGRAFGGGAGGAYNAQNSSAQPGGPGAPGLVIITPLLGSDPS